MATKIDVQGRTATDGLHVRNLKQLFRALDQGGIRHCVLRDYDELAEFEPEKEIDLIVDPRDLGALRVGLRESGFVETPSWGHAPHRFFVAYLRESGMWLKLDVVTALRFGKPVSSLEIDLTADFVSHRVQREIASTLSPEDELFVLLTKSIVNDRRFTESRLLRLLTLLQEIRSVESARERLGGHLEACFGDALRYEDLVERFSREDWRWLLSRRSKIVVALFRRQRFRTIMRHLGISILKWLSPLLFMLFHRGISVAILAPDGAGKSTLADALIRQRHLRARLIYMGTNVEASNVGFPTSQWLRDQRKRPSRNPFVRLAARALRFPNTLLEQWYRSAMGMYHVLRGRTVIYDRYVYDSWVNPRVSGPVKRIRRSLVERSCPVTDLVLLLDAPGEVLYARKGEHTAEALEEKRHVYLRLRERLANMVVVDATREPRAVHEEVNSVLWSYYGSRRTRRGLDGRSAEQRLGVDCPTDWQSGRLHAAVSSVEESADG